MSNPPEGSQDPNSSGIGQVHFRANSIRCQINSLHSSTSQTSFFGQFFFFIFFLSQTPLFRTAFSQINHIHSMAPNAKRSASTQDPSGGRIQKAARRGQAGDAPTALGLDGVYSFILLFFMLLESSGSSGSSSSNRGSKGDPIVFTIVCISPIYSRKCCGTFAPSSFQCRERGALCPTPKSCCPYSP